MRGKDHCIVLMMLAVTLVSAVGISCSKDNIEGETILPSSRRVVTPEPRRVLILYSAGFNSLSSELEADVNDLESGYIPSKTSSSDIILVYSRRTASGYSTPTASYLYRLYSDVSGNVVRDTIRSWPDTVRAASVQTVHEVLSYIGECYPAASYGMIFSSHATGWLPSGYYSSEKITTLSQSGSMTLHGICGMDEPQPVPYVDMNELNPGVPAVKSIGADNIDSRTTVEMEIEAFAEALPMKFNYIIMDACLLGGVEVAYALREKCSSLIFAPTETLADGLCDYKTITGRLLRDEPDLTGLCEDSYNHYASMTGQYQSLTITMVDCTKLENLAAACKDLFDVWRNKINLVDPDTVQPYFRSNKHWFYDIEDILLKAGVTSEEMSAFTEAMQDCIVYKAATEKFLSITISHYSGLSMYLPADGTSELNAFYKKLSWNQATGLVR